MSGCRAIRIESDAAAILHRIACRSADGKPRRTAAAYPAAATAPKVVKKLITAAVPYGAKFFQALATGYVQQRRSWYMFFFQSALAEEAVRHNDFAFLEQIWADWSPGWKWAPDDMAALKECFRKPGTVEAAIGYYRATLGPVFKDAAVAAQAATGLSAPIGVSPSLPYGRRDASQVIFIRAVLRASFRRPTDRRNRPPRPCGCRSPPGPAP